MRVGEEFGMVNARADFCIDRMLRSFDRPERGSREATLATRRGDADGTARRDNRDAAGALRPQARCGAQDGENDSGHAAAARGACERLAIEAVAPAAL